MRNLFIFMVVMAALVMLLPFILGFVLFLICVIFAFMLFVRLGFLPRSSYRTYTFDSRERRGTKPAGQENPVSRPPEGWSQGEQRGEVVTLPETALKRSGDDADHANDSS